mmetsp:Transcript_53609/g.100490  ORF Transcript_53609/g.100490 Transcript_53609/m.100490 type:complete len:290 (+) Transcript_53609:32-901(+)
MTADLGFAVPTARQHVATEAVRTRRVPVASASTSSTRMNPFSALPSFAAALGASAVALAARRQAARKSVAQRVRRDPAKVVPPEAQPLTLTEEEEELLAQGLPVQRQEVKGRQGTGTVVLDVDAPWFVALDRLRSFQEYPQMIPVIRHADVRSRSYPKGHYKAEADYKVSRFWLNISVIHQVDVAAKTVSFNLHPSCGKMVFKEAIGLWQVTQAPNDPNRCRVSLQVKLRASSLLPAWLIDYASQRALGRATSWLKPHVESVWRERLERGLLQDLSDELPERQWQYSLA